MTTMLDPTCSETVKGGLAMQEQAPAPAQVAADAGAETGAGPVRRDFPIRLKLVTHSKQQQQPQLEPQQAGSADQSSPTTTSVSEGPAEQQDLVAVWHPARSQWCREERGGRLQSLFVTVTAGDASHARLRPPDEWLTELLGVAGAASMCVLSVNGEAYREVLQIHRYKDGRDVYVQGAEVRRLFVVLGLEMGDGLFLYPRPPLVQPAIGSRPGHTLPSIALARVPAALNPHAAAVVAGRQAALAKRDAPSPAEQKPRKRKVAPQRAHAGESWAGGVNGEGDTDWRPASRAGAAGARRSTRVVLRTRAAKADEAIDDSWLRSSDSDQQETNSSTSPPSSPEVHTEVGRRRTMDALASLAQVADLGPSTSGKLGMISEPTVLATTLASSLVFTALVRQAQVKQEGTIRLVSLKYQASGAEIITATVVLGWGAAAHATGQRLIQRLLSLPPSCPAQVLEMEQPASKPGTVELVLKGTDQQAIGQVILSLTRADSEE